MPLSADGERDREHRLVARKRITARYRPKRTKVGMLTATTASIGRPVGQIWSSGWPAFRLIADHRASGIINVSAQTEIMRLVGRGNSTVRRR